MALALLDADTMTNLTTSRSPLLAAVLLTALAGCAADPDDSAGSLEIPLTAPGTDGSTYRLPDNAALAIDAPGFHDILALDGPQAVRRFNLPPGDYSARLVQGDAELAVWPLERTDVAGNVTVYAELQNPSPMPLHIAKNEVTALTLTFKVPHGGNVSFGRGHLDVSVAIDEVAAAGAMFEADGGYTNPAFVVTDPNLPWELVSALPASNASDVYADLQMLLSGSFTPITSLMACAPATLSASSASYTGLAALIDEAGHDPGTVCVQSHEGYTYVFFNLESTLQPVDGPFAIGAGSLRFDVSVEVMLPGEIFDGETFDLASLEVPTARVSTFYANVTRTYDGHSLFTVTAGNEATFWYTPLL